MRDFKFYAPTYFCFGKKAEENIGKMVKRFGGSKVLIHYGGGSIKKNGVYDKVVASLEASSIPYVELGGVMPNPRSGLVYEGIALCRKENVDFILAVGGGSTIDSSKAIAAGVPYDGDFWDYYKEFKLINEALPLGTVLTMAAAGSEGSGDSVVTLEDGMKKWDAHGDAIRPKFSILNPQNTCSLPAYETACGITDIMAHICERYFTTTTDVEVTDRLCEGLLKALIVEAPKAIANLQDYEARANIMWGGMVAHNNIVGVGRVQDWSSHMIEHELSSLYDVAHGAGLSVMMPAWMTYVVEKNPDKFVQFAVRVWDLEENEDPMLTAKAGIEKFRNFLTSIGMPKNFEEIGAKEEDIDEMVSRLRVSDENPIGGYVKLKPQDVKEILKIAAKA